MPDPEADAEHAWPYRILNVLGGGPTGTSYFAEQAQPTRRLVVVKVLRTDRWPHHAAAIDVVERYRCRQAALDHPHIARVIDAGVTEQGRAYLVTEHVVGLPLRQFCERFRLNASDRLRVLQTVCDAIDHAHARDMTHGHLTSTNVLVVKRGASPWPMVLDFGVSDLAARGESR